MTSSPGWNPPGWGTTSPGWAPYYAPDRAITWCGVPIWTDHSAQVRPGQWGITCETIEGWDGVQTRTAAVDVPLRGAIAGVTDYSPRTVTIEGLVIGSARYGDGSIEHATRALSALTRGQLVVTDRAAGALWCTGRLTALRISPSARGIHGSEVWAPYSMTVVCDDPTKYSQRTTPLAAGVTRVTNSGTADAYPLLQLGAGTHEITHPRGTLRLNLGSLPSGATGWIADCDRGTVWTDDGRLASRIGRDWTPSGLRRDGLWRGIWPVIPGGVTQRWEVVGPGGIVRRHEGWR